MKYQLEDETSFGRIISKCLSMHPRLLDSNNFRVDAAHFNKLFIHLILIVLNNLINSQNYLYEKRTAVFPRFAFWVHKYFPNYPHRIFHTYFPPITYFYALFIHALEPSNHAYAVSVSVYILH